MDERIDRRGGASRAPSTPPEFTSEQKRTHADL
jgi:hypothetical protein